MENSIRLSHYEHASRVAGGVKTEVNGVELQEVVDIHLYCPVDGLPRLEVQQNVYPGLDVTLNGIVQPEIIALPGLDIDVEHISPTQTRYRGVQRGRECINCHREFNGRQGAPCSFGPATPPGEPRKEVGPFCQQCIDLINEHKVRS